MLTELTIKLQKPVFFDHDGSADDFIALLTLLTFDNCRLTGITITNGRCCIDAATETTLRILDLFCRKDIIVSKGNVQGVNQFPDQLRKTGVDVNSIAILQECNLNLSNISDEDPTDFIANRILNEQEKTTVVLTGPSTNMYNAFLKYPEIIHKIDKILWLAGAFLADGNVIAPDHDGSAEWNIFGDPVSASGLLSTGVPIVLFPLDACYHVTIDNFLLYNLEQNVNSRLSNLCYQLLLVAESRKQKKYFFDLLPVMYLKFPELFHLENTAINIEQRGTSLGNIFRSSLGSKIKYVKTVDDELFCELFLEQVDQF